MRKYIASVTMKNKETGKKELTIIESEYDRKSDFYNDLRKNGYSVRFITTEEKFDEDCEKWHEANERSKRIRKAIYASDKMHAEKMNMTVAEYRTWCNAYIPSRPGGYEDNERSGYVHRRKYQSMEICKEPNTI